MPLPKNTSFVIVLGKRDRIVQYEKASAVYQVWSQLGLSIKVITKRNLGHLGIIRWYKQNLESLIEDAEELTR